MFTRLIDTDSLLSIEISNDTQRKGNERKQKTMASQLNLFTGFSGSFTSHYSLGMPCRDGEAHYEVGAFHSVADARLLDRRSLSRHAWPL